MVVVEGERVGVLFFKVATRFTIGFLTFLRIVFFVTTFIVFVGEIIILAVSSLLLVILGIFVVLLDFVETLMFVSSPTALDCLSS